MPKSQLIDPKKVRQKGEISFGVIPVNSYRKSIAGEKKNFSDHDFLRIFRDMTLSASLRPC